MLFSDRLQKRVPIQERFKVKKKPKFEEVGMALYTCLMSNFDDEHEMVTTTRQGSLGSDLSILEALLDSERF